MPSRLTSPPALGPLDFGMFTGLPVPDPITFVVSPKWCGRPQLYPRQATLLKVIFLRNDLLTEYDHAVIDEWEESFRKSGNNGITPGIRQRMASLALQGYSYFREVLLVLGRRAGKGYVSALAMAYVLWRFMAKGDPQGYYGIDRDKQLALFVYAGKKQQARENLWKDLVNVVQGAPCFTRYISRPLGENLTVFAPYDFVRLKELRRRGIATERDMATFTIQPKEATLMSARGPASCVLAFDEMAHVVPAGAGRSAEEVYGSATPSLDQFKLDGFIIDPSSPWQQVGQFYANWQMSLALDDDGEPEHPYMMMLQLASWEIYYDWQQAHLLPMFPEGFAGDLDEYLDAPQPSFLPLKGAVQEFDERMEKLERANPDTFAVERRSHWQAVVDAYLDPKKVDAIFRADLPMRSEAENLTTRYAGHADPSKVNDNFGMAIAHTVPLDDESGLMKVRFDLIHHWMPSEFPDNTIDYIEVTDRLWDMIWAFKVDEFTFDQHNSAMPIATLVRKVRQHHAPKRMDIHEETAPQPLTAKVLTPYGWTTMGQLEVGSEVIGRDGLPHKVVGVYPKGVKTVYRVTFQDGAQTECTADHLWAVRKGSRKGLETRTLQEMMDLGLRMPSGPHKWAVPRVAPVQYRPSGDLPIDPYLLGVLLGDGSLGPGVTVACSLDDVEEQMKLLSAALPEGARIRWERQSNKQGHEWAKIFITGEGWRNNPVLDGLREIGLFGCTGERKFIPERYLRASQEDRVALLQGLMDSDGTSRAAKGRHRCMFSSKYRSLIEGVKDLVGGLGGSAKVARYGDRTPEVRITGLGEIVPFRLTRKADAHRPTRVMDHRFIVKVEEIGEAETQCISVDVEDHLYVTGDFVLTHNTAQHNWQVAECFKVAINQGWVEAPEYETAQLELKFLQLKTTATTNRVVHQDTGPVIHDDVAKCMMEVTWRLLADQVQAWSRGMLEELKPVFGQQGGMNPYSRMEQPDQSLINQLSPAVRNMVRGGGLNPARNPHRRSRR